MNPLESFSFPVLLKVLLQKTRILLMCVKLQSRYYSSGQQFLPQDYENMAGRSQNDSMCATCQSGGL